MKNFEVFFVNKILNEKGAAKKTGEILKNSGIKSTLIITDKGIVNAGLLKNIEDSLNKESIKYKIFSEVLPDPPEHIVFKGTEILKKEKIESVIGIGGGSSMDTAKVVSLLGKTEINLDKIYGINFTNCKRLPLFLIPTTTGTGSEVTPYAVLTKGEAKCTVISPVIIPDIAILDEELVYNLPPKIIASTGIDAMVHAIEAFTTKNKKNFISDILAKESLKLLAHNIYRAVNEHDNFESKGNMLVGACVAGLAFTNAPVAAVHAFAYPLGGIFHISHGLSNSLMLIEVMKFNMDVALNEYYELALTVYPDFHKENKSKKEIVNKFIEKLDSLRKNLGIPTKLSDVGITENDLKKLTDEVIKLTRLFNNNPKEITYNDAYKIYSNSL